MAAEKICRSWIALLHFSAIFEKGFFTKSSFGDGNDMDRLMEWFGDGKYQKNLDRILRFWRGEERFMISINSEMHNYRQKYDDSIILEMAPSNLKAHASLPGVNLPAFIADFGTVSTGRYWGGSTRFDSTGSNLFIDPVADSVESALFIEPLAVEDPSMDAARAIRLYRGLSEKLETKSLWMRTPDMQGVLNTAAFILDQKELFVSFYDQPDLTHHLLGKICHFLIAYAKYLRRMTSDKICGNIWPYVFFPSELGFGITEDMMPLLSADLYEEYGIPYLKSMADALGGLVIHCCGEWGRHVPALKKSGLPIKAMEFHYPFTLIEELEPLVDKVVWIPYISLEKQKIFSSEVDYYRHLLKNTSEAHRYWFAFPSETEEAVGFAREFGS